VEIIRYAALISVQGSASRYWRYVRDSLDGLRTPTSSDMLRRTQAGGGSPAIDADTWLKEMALGLHTNRAAAPTIRDDKAGANTGRY